MQWIDFQQTLQQRVGQSQLDDLQDRVRNASLQGHSLVRGVAGSGKSLVLKQRVERIVAQQLSPILVLSYNRFMQGWLAAMLADQAGSVECRTFHQWSYHTIGYDFQSDRSPISRQQAIARAGACPKRYQAILVDEAQDFYDEWFQILLQVLDSQTNSLFFVYDNTQSVYGQAHRRIGGWSWAKLGIEVMGRSQIFDVNYRNSPEILEVAWKFAKPALEEAGMRWETRESNPPIDRIIEPKKHRARSFGILPILLQIQAADLPTEIAHQVKLALKSHPTSSIGILTHPTHPDRPRMRDAISRALCQLGIRHHAPTRSQERWANVVARPYVILDSWNALKGVEFDAVIIAGVDLVREYPDDRDRSFAEKAGLYTAMTRARDHLILLYHEKTAIVEQLEAAWTAPDTLMWSEKNP